MAGFNTRKHLKAYVRYDGTGRIVAGSLVLASSKPKNGDWVEIPAYDCCGGGAVNCNSFWINQTFNPDNPGGVYAVGSGIDSQCNTFMLIIDYWTSPNNPNQDSGQNCLLQKFNDAGELVWNRVFDFAESGVTFNYIESQTMIVDKEDNPICFVIGYDNVNNKTVSSIVKFDNDGNQLWSKTLLNDLGTGSREAVNSIAFDASNNMYVSFYNDNNGDYTQSFPCIKKISPAGVVLASKKITITGYSNESYLNVNSAGEVYLVFQIALVGIVYIIKLDDSLNEIWNKSFTPPTNGFPYGVALDKDENIVFQIGNSAAASPDPLYGAYIKVSPQGDVIWTTRISNINNLDYSLGTYQLNSDADGNIYISSVYIQDIPNYSGTSNSLIVAKLSPAGALEWVYFVQPPPIASMDSWYWYSPIAGTVKNNSLVLGYYDGDDPFNAQLLKLPLVPVADGVYGDYTFTNITSDWTTSSPTVTLSDDTVDYINGSTDTAPLTYLQFEGTYTTINTPL